jgi:hypothetical protein
MNNEEFFKQTNIPADCNPLALAKVMRRDPNFLSWVRVTPECFNNTLRDIKMIRGDVLMAFQTILGAADFNLENLDMDLLSDLTNYLSMNHEIRQMELTNLASILNRLSDTNVAVFFANLLLSHQNTPDGLATFCTVVGEIVYHVDMYALRLSGCLQASMNIIRELKGGVDLIKNIAHLSNVFNNIPRKTQEIIFSLTVF